MSDFAVWGMTILRARSIALQKTPAVLPDGTVIPESEWTRRVEGATDAIMRGSQIKQLSDKFDMPQVAQQFIVLMRRAGAHRNLHVRAWRQLKDDAGKPIFTKGGKKPRMGWVDYFPKEDL
jgi:hypothetical protein